MVLKASVFGFFWGSSVIVARQSGGIFEFLPTHYLQINPNRAWHIRQSGIFAKTTDFSVASQ